MKHMIRRLFCTLLTAALCLSSTTPALAAKTSKKYQAALQSYASLTSQSNGKYKIIDLDKNGIPELLYHNLRTHKDEVYTYHASKKKRVRLAAMAPGQLYFPGADYSGLSYSVKKKAFRVACSTTGDIVEKYYRVSGTKKRLLASFVAKRNYTTYKWTYKMNGKKVSQSTFSRKLKTMRKQYKYVLN